MAALKEQDMKNSDRRLHFLSIDREQLRNEQDQMEYSQVPQISTKATSEPPDPFTVAIVVAAMMLVFASIFLVQ